jgi:flavin-dependent dehydrogenase
MLDAEAIAVGGGLAGAAFALELARNGRDVIVLEASEGAHHKVCGEFISTEARHLLDYLGLDIDALGASSVGTLRIAVGDRVATAPLPFRAAGLSRHLLDETLLGAAERAGALVERGVRVSGLDVCNGDIIAVAVGAATYRCRHAALATGKHALRGYPRPPSDKVALKLQLRVSPEASRIMHEHVQLVAFEDGYIGSCFVEDGLITLCWVMRDRRLKRIGSSWREQADALAGCSRHLRVVLHDALPEWDKPVAVAGIPYGFLRRRAISPTIYSVGDQLAVIPSYTGDGNAIALYSGIAAAQAVLAGENAIAFHGDLIPRLQRQFRWATTVNALFDYRLGQRVGIAAASRFPGMMTRIAHSTRLTGYEHVLGG